MNAVELAERALAAAPAGEGGALATVSSERSVMLRYARNRPTQSTAIDDLTVEIAVVRGGRVGKASTNATDDDSLARCAHEAEASAQAMARTAGEDGYPGFPKPQPVPECNTFDEATAALDPAQGGAALSEAFAVAEERGVEAHGTWTVGDVETAIASSEGVLVSGRSTDALMKVVCIAPSGRSGYATAAGRSVSDIVPREIAREAASKAVTSGDPVALPPGEYPVVLEPAAVGDLLAMLAWLTFNGLAYVEDRSAFSDRLGEQLASPAVNLSDSPRFPRTLQRGFDAEGVPKLPLPLIQDGVAKNVVHDTATAARAGTKSTGHATAAGGSTYGPIACNLVLLGGGARDIAELCRSIERGVYVTRLWYVNPVRPKETLLTGVTRDGTFLIEDGEITRPVVDMRFTDSALGLLERTQALSSTPVLTSDGEFYGRRFATGVVCPALRASSMRFTG